MAENELIRRAKVIRSLPKDLVPELQGHARAAAKKRLRLHPLVMAGGECQEIFAHPDHGAAAERYAQAIIKGGPRSASCWCCRRSARTQEPARRVRANIGIQFCLRAMDQVSNDMGLPTSSCRRWAERWPAPPEQSPAVPALGFANPAAGCPPQPGRHGS